MNKLSDKVAKMEEKNDPKKEKQKPTMKRINFQKQSRKKKAQKLRREPKSRKKINQGI